VATAKILAIEAGTSIHLAQLPYQPDNLVGLPALSARLLCFVPTINVCRE